MSRNYLEGLPADVATQITLNRVVGAAEAAAFCNFSLAHWRRLYRAGKVPKPVKLSGRKLGWRQGTLIEFNSQRIA